MIPGEVIPAQGDIELNAGATQIVIEVANTGDRAIQVGFDLDAVRHGRRGYAHGLRRTRAGGRDRA